MKPIINPGTVIRPYGTIKAVLWTGGERYYMLIDEGSISMMPADVIEPMYERQYDNRHRGQ